MRTSKNPFPGMSSPGSGVVTGKVQFFAYRQWRAPRIHCGAYDVNYVKLLVLPGLLAHRFSLRDDDKQGG